MDRNVEVDAATLDRPTTEDVVDLLDDLRREGFSLGIEQYLHAEKLRLAWSASSARASETLRLRLGPVLCKSSNEQAVFADRFAEHATKWHPQWHDVAPAPVPPPPQARGWWWVVLGALLLVALSFMLVRIPPRPLPDDVPPPLESPSAPGPGATGAPEIARTVRLTGVVLDRGDRAVVGATVALPDGSRALSDSSGGFALETRMTADLDLLVSHPEYQTCRRFLLGEKPMRIDVRLAPSLGGFASSRWHAPVRMALLLAPLVALACWWAWARSRRRLIIERLPTREQIDFAAIPLPAPRELLFSSARASRAQVELAIHRAVESTDLDEAATVEAMAHSLGLFRPVYKARRILPAYLALGDRLGLSDQQARLVEEILGAIAIPKEALTRFWFSSDPRLCVSVDRRRERVGLRELHARHGGHRLLLFTDGSGLLDPTSGALAQWLHLLALWEERAILTPVPPSQWGDRELLLAQAGFHVLPLSLEGLRAFATSLRDPSEASVSFSRWAPSYPPLLEARSKRWLERNPIAASDREELLRQLRLYMGDDGFRWLCACAVYPALTWYLTLFLGLRLARSAGGKVLDEESLLRLVRLPWFRHGTMPDWLRVILLAGLSPDDEATVRTALTGLLLSDPRDPASAFLLEFGTPQQRRRAQRSARAMLRDLLRYRTAQGPLRDYVFVTFLLGRRLDKLQLVAPNALQRMVFRRGVRALGLRPAAAVALALAGTAVGWAAGSRLPWSDGVAFCDVFVREPVAEAPNDPGFPPLPGEAPQDSPSATPAVLPPTTPEVSAKPPSPFPDSTARPSPSAAVTSAPTAKPTINSVLAALDKIRFSPASLAQLNYGRAQDFAVVVPAQVPPDQLSFAWTVDGRAASQGRRFRFESNRPDLVRKEPVKIEVRVQPRAGEAIVHDWRVVVRPPVPSIKSTSPPARIGIPASAEPTRFDIVADAPVGAQQLSYVFLVDGREASRTSQPTFDHSAVGGTTVAAFVVDDYGQESSRVTWKFEQPTAILRDLAQGWLGSLQSAWNAKDADAIGQMLRFNPAQIATLKRSLEDKTDFQVNFDDVKIQEASRTEATVTYQRTETFVDGPSGRSMKLGPRDASHRLRLEDGKVVSVGPGG